MLVLAIDIGTSSSRSALFTRAGARIPGTMAQEQYHLATDRLGAATLDPHALESAVRDCLARTLAAPLPRPLRAAPIVGVGMSCFWHSLIGTSADYTPLTPIYTWADTRCRPDAARLRLEQDEAAVQARTGCMLRTSFWPAKLRWLARTERRLTRSVQRWMSPAEWLTQRLIGRTACAHGMATGTGCYDPSRRQWDAAMLDLAGLRSEQLHAIDDTPLQAAHGASGPALPAVLAEALWHPAIGDGAASNLGSGATRPGYAAINVGTSGAIRIMRTGDRCRAPFGLFCYRVDRERYLIGGAISNAGNLRAWCMQELRHPGDDAGIEAALAARPLPAHGLQVLPFWAGDRAPTWREDVTGCITGLTLSTTALDILQATSEAAYQRLATILERIPDQARIRHLIVGGGIQHSPSSLQRLSDILGRPLIASTESEASLRGAAVLVLERQAGRRQLAGVSGVRVRPSPAARRAYAEQRRQLAALEQTLFPDHEPGRPAARLEAPVRSRAPTRRRSASPLSRRPARR